MRAPFPHHTRRHRFGSISKQKRLQTNHIRKERRRCMPEKKGGAPTTPDLSRLILITMPRRPAKGGN